MKKLYASWVWVTLVAGLLPAQIPEPAVLQDRTPLPVAETLHYRVHWGMVKAGTFVLQTDPPGTWNAVPAVHMTADIRTAGPVETFFRVRDYSEAWYDPAQGRVLEFRRDVKEGKYAIEETMVPDYAALEFHRVCRGTDYPESTAQKGPIPGPVVDLLTALADVRTRKIAVGDTYSLNVLSGKKVWPIRIDVRRREKISVSAGKFTCFMMEVRRQDLARQKMHLQVWITDDERKVPVLLRSVILVGHVTAELVRDAKPK